MNQRLSESCIVAGAVLAALLSGSAPRAQQSAPPQFRSRVDLVHLDVSVLDGNRRPVLGLTANDFTILEEGEPRAVSAFSAVEVPDPEPPPTAWMRDVASDVRRNTDVASRRLVVIVMDDATIPFDQPMIRSAREIGRLAVEKLGLQDLASVVFTRDNRNAQEFTDDRARLLRAIDAFEYGGRTIGLPEDSPPGVVLSELAPMISTIDTLDRVAEALAEVPERRKAVIYVGVGVPVDAAGAAEIVMVQPTSDGGAAPAELGAMARRMMERMRDTYRRAQRANVNIYTVSPAGVGGMAALIQSQAWQHRLVPAYETPSNYFDFLTGIAENTGGRSFPDRNEFPSALETIFQENGSYYLLGYQPPNPVADGKFRRVEVKVKRPGVTVRTRSGYYNAKADQPTAPAPPPLAAALSGLLPKGEIPLDVMAAPFPVGGKAESGVVVVLTVHEDLPARPARTTQDVDLQITAFTQDGTPRGSERLATKVTLRPGPAGPASYEVLSRITLRPGRYQLRLSAVSGGRSGSVYYDIDVPDFSARPLSISGLLLTSEPKPVSTPADRIRDVVPIVPTARREFAPYDRVTLFARLYQGGRDPLVATNVSVKVTDSSGTVRINRSEVVAGASAAVAAPSGLLRTPRGLPSAADTNPLDRAADLQLDLPLRSLPPGEYLLTVEASTSRGSARRDLRFTVK